MIFQRTWGLTPEPFWPKAIAAVREAHLGFTFLAEAYWDLEWELQQQGFDYCYDKRLYDRLCHGDAGALRAHLGAGLDYQDRLARFVENHDEPRAAAVFPGRGIKRRPSSRSLAPGPAGFSIKANSRALASVCLCPLRRGTDRSPQRRHRRLL